MSEKKHLPGVPWLLVDTSAVVAIAHRRDEHHNRAIFLLQQAHEAGAVFMLTNFLLAEAYSLLLIRGGADLAREWLRDNDIPVYRITETDEAKALEILFKYNDKDFSYVDATSFAAMESLALNTAFIFDQHFRQFGWQAWGDNR